MSIDSVWLWIGFHIFIFAMLALDLWVVSPPGKEVSVKSALRWSGVWVGLAALFGMGIYYFSGTQKALEFAAGYIIEESLSVDNLFVFLAVFGYFKVELRYQHKVLFWGILGALVMRALFIMAGVTLLNQFHGIIYIFGAFLVFTGIRLMFQKEHGIDPEHNPVLRLLRRFVRVTRYYYGDRFFIKKLGYTFATPLFAVLVLLETTDLIFAIDSIPAILAITQDPFIVYTSNIFAILGLRSLYFALAGVLRIFHYLNYGMAAVLAFVGVKMLLMDFYKIPIAVALAVVVAILTLSVVASMIFPKKEAVGEALPGEAG
jgi:tellurite resistance protein TerC